ncbi:hypothetical protein [Paenibacillus glucanolyticus]|uniref:hypothetical protein n=2 Tax=Paenibacillus TaxID=44249 RepID=UPI0020A5AC31|nr:hypothetical protein [Paenibacillus sp. Cedars]
MTIAEEHAIEKVRNLLQSRLNEKDDHFSNSRFVRNLFDDITLNQSKRLSNLPGNIAKESLMLITKEESPSSLLIRGNCS